MFPHETVVGILKVDNISFSYRLLVMANINLSYMTSVKQNTLTCFDFWCIFTVIIVFDRALSIGNIIIFYISAGWMAQWLMLWSLTDTPRVRP